MKLVPAKCPFCGGTLQVDPEKEAAVCEFCKQPFIVEKAITNYNTTIVNNHNYDGANIHVENVNLVNDSNPFKQYSFEQLIELANKAYYPLGEYLKDEEYGDEMIRREPNRYEGYKFKAIGLHFGKGESEKAFNYLLQAYDLADGEKRRTETYDIDGVEKTITFGTEKEQCVRWMKQVLSVFPAIDSVLYHKILLPLTIRGIVIYAPVTISFVDCPENSICIDGLEIYRFDKPQLLSYLLMSSSYKHTICSPWKKNGTEGNFGLVDNDKQIEILCKFNKKESRYQIFNISNGENTELENGQSTNGGCYVATCVYGSYDCPQVWALRRYRDFYLDEHWWGRLFIRLYYYISPKIIKLFGKTRWFRTLNKSILDKKVEKLKEKGYQTTAYKDKY